MLWIKTSHRLQTLIYKDVLIPWTLSKKATCLLWIVTSLWTFLSISRVGFHLSISFFFPLLAILFSFLLFYSYFFLKKNKNQLDTELWATTCYVIFSLVFHSSNSELLFSSLLFYSVNFTCEPRLPAIAKLNLNSCNVAAYRQLFFSSPTPT